MSGHLHDALKRLGRADSAGKEVPPVRRFTPVMDLNLNVEKETTRTEAGGAGSESVVLRAGLG